MLSCRLSIDKNTLSRPSHQRFFCRPPNSGGHVTRPNQGLSSLALGGGERETLGTRLATGLKCKTPRSHAHKGIT